MLFIRAKAWLMVWLGLSILLNPLSTGTLRCEVYFQSPQISCAKNDVSREIAIFRDGDTDRACSVDICSSDATAVNGIDYSFDPQTVIFSAGQTYKSTFLKILNNNSVTTTRDFCLYLTNAVNTTIGTPSSTAITILEDNIVPPMVQVEDLRVIENCGTAPIKVTRVGTCERQSAISYTTVDGTATVAKDYRRTYGTVFFNAGVSNQVIDVIITNNVIREGSRYFNFRIYNPIGCTAGQTNAIITIRDDDRHEMPTPKIEPISSGMTRVLWPTNTLDLRLQISQDLVHWTQITNSCPILMNEFCITNSTINGCQFFRLDQK